MSSADNRQSSAATEQRIIKKPFNLPSRIIQPVEQSPFPASAPSAVAVSDLQDSSTYPAVTGPLSETITAHDPISPPSGPITSHSITRHLPEYNTNTSPNATRPLTVVQTSVLPYLRSSTTTSLRHPVVIRGSGKKNKLQLRPPSGRRWVVQIAVTSLIVLIAITTLLSVVPIDNAGGHILNPFQSISTLVHLDTNSPNLIAQQAATATAITQQDGYDPGSNQPGNASSNSFPYGQCTYWADFRYHQWSGHYVPWRGNADAWAYGARQYGWVVSDRPHVPSIIVLQPGVQGAGWLGHVAFVEHINPDGSVYTSNMNWYANGGWGYISYWTFTPGPGVSFIWL